MSQRAVVDKLSAWFFAQPGAPFAVRVVAGTGRAAGLLMVEISDDGNVRSADGVTHVTTRPLCAFEPTDPSVRLNFRHREGLRQVASRMADVAMKIRPSGLARGVSISGVSYQENGRVNAEQIEPVGVAVAWLLAALDGSQTDAGGLLARLDVLCASNPNYPRLRALLVAYFLGGGEAVVGSAWPDVRAAVAFLQMLLANAPSAPVGTQPSALLRGASEAVVAAAAAASRPLPPSATPLLEQAGLSPRPTPHATDPFDPHTRNQADIHPDPSGRIRRLFGRVVQDAPAPGSPPEPPRAA